MATRGIERTELGEAAAHESFLRHRRFYWAKLAGGLSALAILIYLLTDVQPRHNGGSWYGYLLGTLGFALILWLTALGVRKRNITRKAWSLKGWISAHIYLGLSLIVIATLHTGFQFGWNVHTLAYALMMVVILSGIYGVVAYARLPETLSDNRGEMTAVQMIDAVASLDKQLQVAAQPLSDADTAIVLGSLGEDPFGGGLWRRLSGRVRGGGTDEALAAIRRRQTESAGDATLDQVEVLLQRKAAALTRVRRHARLRALLEIWLYVHIPVTFALIAALIAHVISVFFYW